MKKREKILYIAGIAVVAIAFVAAAVIWQAGRKTETPAAARLFSDEPERETVIREVEVEKVVEVEKTIASDTIEDGLNDIGKLITEEYWFTDVVSYSSVKKMFGLEIGLTESYFVVGYDGVVSAGVDFTDISVSKNDDEGTIMVYIPKSEIQSVSIDEDSFEVFSEKEGLWNNISVSDFNTSVSELKANARDKAVERGVLERADENAVRVISEFIESLTGKGSYNLIFETKED